MIRQSGKEAIRVVLADDHSILRAGMNSMLSNTGEFAVVAEVSNGKEAIAAVIEFKPDLLILDISMPLMNGTEAIQQVKRRCRNTKVLIMTMHRGEEYVRMAMQGGADGYILKDDAWEELAFAIRHVLKGNTYLSPSISNKVVSGFLDGSTSESGVLGKLTPRERQTLKLIAEGMKNREIAEFMSVSVKTVEKHRSNLMRKLDLHNSAAITAFAIESGVVGG
ncbi:MAG: response regulator transcription factor [Gammaproteobacteria bacterium]|jgi:DNA-binding NarL/FixJ family response regulator|nr:DNA-binding response regulator [Chromatiales bacterium]MDP6674077.1 response regulator transcription factor [Gammaproteobacteria bacterium]